VAVQQSIGHNLKAGPGPRPDPILQIHKFLFDRGGLERYLFYLIGELEKRGHRVIGLGVADPRNRPAGEKTYVVSPVSFPDHPSLRNGLTAARGLARALYSREAYRRTRQLIEETRPEVAHVHELHHHLSPSVLIALREAGIPVVLSAHEYKLVCPKVHLHDGKGICEACRGHRYWNPVLRACSKGSRLRSTAAALESTVHHILGMYDSRYVQVITAGSEFTLGKLREFGVSSERLELLTYVLDPADWGPPAAEPGRYLAFVGRLAGYKGAATLVRALALAGDPEALIVGDGPERPQLQQLAESLELRRLRLTGFLPAHELRRVLEDAVAVVVPSEVLETFGFAAYEAMALGRPVIASRLGPLPELVVDGETGLLFEAGNPEDLALKLRQVMDDKLSAHRMGHSARRWVELKTDPDRHYRRLMEIYEKAGARRAAGALMRSKAR
jgi:glycosyltransferase involved in cell wall biosynthesis